MELLLLTLTITSLAVAVAAALFAWHALRRERLRSDARVAALAADIAAEDSEANVAVAAAEPDSDLSIREANSTGVDRMFAVQRPVNTMARLAVVAAGGAVVVAMVIGVLMATSGESTRSAVRDSQTTAPAALELVALQHEREADRLTVRGAISRSSAADEPDDLTAVVQLFDRDGGLVASGRGQLDRPVSGADWTFVVTVPDVPNVARYRVSFRHDDEVVPHVDKRVEVGG